MGGRSPANAGFRLQRVGESNNEQEKEQNKSAGRNSSEQRAVGDRVRTESAGTAQRSGIGVDIGVLEEGLGSYQSEHNENGPRAEQEAVGNQVIGDDKGYEIR